MRALTFLVIFLAVIYGGYWAIGARALENGTNSAVAQMRADGWLLNIADVATKGFPSRFDTTLSNVEIAPPDGTWRYSAPFVQALALSYAPNKLIAVLPQQQQIDLLNQSLNITSTTLRASTGVAANPDLDFQGFTAEGADLSVQSSWGWSIAANNLLAAMRPNAQSEAAHDIYAELSGIKLGQGLSQQLASMPDLIESVSFDAIVSLNVPLDRHSFQTQSEIIPTDLTLKAFKLLWGEVKLSAKGDFVITNGYPVGQLDLTISKWDQLVDALVANGLVEAEVAKTYSDVAALLATEAGDLEVPVTFQNGLISYGILPLGPAPRFY